MESHAKQAIEGEQRKDCLYGTVYWLKYLMWVSSLICMRMLSLLAGVIKRDSTTLSRERKALWGNFNFTFFSYLKAWCIKDVTSY